MSWCDTVNIQNTDCLPELKKVETNFYDLALVDPPYGIDIGKMSFTNPDNNGSTAATKRKDYSKISDWDSKPPSEEYFKELFRVSKNQIIFGWNYFVPFLSNCKCYLVWDKRTDSKYNNDFADCEQAWTSFNKPARVYRFLWSGMIQGDMKNKEKRIHPTQKPVNLYRAILKDFAQKGHKVLDTHIGSASIALACFELGIELDGFEINKEIYTKAKKRFFEERKLSLFS